MQSSLLQTVKYPESEYWQSSETEHASTTSLHVSTKHCSPSSHRAVLLSRHGLHTFPEQYSPDNAQSASLPHSTHTPPTHTLRPLQSSVTEHLAPIEQLPVQVGRHVPLVQMFDPQSSASEQLPPTSQVPLQGRHWFAMQ